MLNAQPITGICIAPCAPKRHDSDASTRGKKLLLLGGAEIDSEFGEVVEVIEDASWTDHLRRFDRVSAADAALRERKLAFHLGEEPPLVRRTLRESTARRTPP